MYHKHEVTIRFNPESQIWIVYQAGDADEYYLYPNGQIKVGFFEEETTYDATNKYVHLEIGLE